MARRLLDEGHEVVGIDGLRPNYDLNSSYAATRFCGERPRFSGHEAMLEDFAARQRIYGDGFDVVCHFAAQAGVRYKPRQSARLCRRQSDRNFNLLELMRHARRRMR